MRSLYRDLQRVGTIRLKRDADLFYLHDEDGSEIVLTSKEARGVVLALAVELDLDVTEA